MPPFGRQYGCIGMASDTWIGNEISQRCHESLGFKLVDRCMHYRKGLKHRVNFPSLLRAVACSLAVGEAVQDA
jgi:hypothetical protein